MANWEAMNQNLSGMGRDLGNYARHRQAIAEEQMMMQNKFQQDLDLYKQKAMFDQQQQMDMFQGFAQKYPQLFRNHEDGTNHPEVGMGGQGNVSAQQVGEPQVSAPTGFQMNPNFAFSKGADPFIKKPDNSLVLQQKKDQRMADRISKMNDQLDPSGKGSKAFGISKNIFDRAERLQSLASAFPDGNLDSRQIEELAIGLNSMLQGSNVGAQRQVEALVPKSIYGNAKKLQEWLVNEPQGTGQQAFVKRLLGTIEREKVTAEEQINRTRFSRLAQFSDVEANAPEDFNNVLQSWDINPEEYKKWKLEGYKKKSAVQGPESVGRVSVIAPNGKRGHIPAGQLEEALKSGYRLP